MLMGLRTILFKLAFVVCTLLWAILIMLMIVLPFRVRHRLATGWGDTVVWLARIICGIRWEVHGMEHLPKQASVMVLNHQSTWETVFTPLLLRDQVWVLKKELIHIPFFGWAMGSLRPIAINRNKRKAAMAQVIDQGRQRLSMGFWVVMYPEGTRSLPHQPRPFKTGAVKLAHELGVQIVPIAHNAGQFWPKRGWMHSGTVQVVIGEPVLAAGKPIEALNQDIEQWVHSTAAKLERQEDRRRESDL